MAGCDDVPFDIIAGALEAGIVVPFLGAAASAIYRPPGVSGWEPGRPYYPFGKELAKDLASRGRFPDDARAGDLALVASYYVYRHGDRRLLNQHLRNSLDIPCRPGLLHRLLAAIPKPLLYVTTNYDDLIEQALSKRDYHLVVDRGEKARVWVARRQGRLREVKAGALREELQPDDIPIVYKLHGCLDRQDPANDSFLITEQDYVDFLGRGATLIPSYLQERMTRMSFLFLGYSLVDWNVRVLLRKLSQPLRRQGEDIRSWSITVEPGLADSFIWSRHGVEMYDCDLNLFTKELAKRLKVDVNAVA